MVVSTRPYFSSHRHEICTITRKIGLKELWYLTKNVEFVSSAECRKIILGDLMENVMLVTTMSNFWFMVLQMAGGLFSLITTTRQYDLNVLNFDFLQPIVSLKHKVLPNTVDELVKCVKKVFDDLDRQTVLQTCMESTLFVEGANSYKISSYQ